MTYKTKLKATLIAMLLSTSAFAFPDKPLTIYAGTQAGTGLDATARLFADEMGKKLGHKIQVINEPGAVGGLAATNFKNRNLDGHNMLLVWNGTFGHAILNKTSYDETDFVPVGIALTSPMCISVGPNSPYKTFGELVAAAKKEAIPYGSPGAGDTSAIFISKFEKMTDTHWTLVPYPRSAQQLTDLAGGHLPLLISTCTAQAGIIDGKMARVLAVSSGQRHPRLTDIPTVAELGYKDIDLSSWFILLANKNIPADQLKKLNALMVEVQNDPKVKARIWAMNGKNTPMNVQDAQKYFDKEVANYRMMLK